MYRENYINSLTNEMLELVAKSLTPAALKYGYCDIPLETGIKWKPIVLLLGNYSSGKSTLINEFLGFDIQKTGQAPTDDSFTIITNDESVSANEYIRVTEERDGKVLLNDPEYPFVSLKKHGQRFASHFRLKKTNSPFLNNIALIDTPGMLDSISEKNRGYNYQEVVGDLVQLADLVLVLFDPHKAGTVREAHISLRETLPSRTFEDRVHFVLNRVDECASVIDLIRVYGTLCWNLSQITGRKDIPMIHLTYSKNTLNENKDNLGKNHEYLEHLENQREELKKVILNTPQYHLDKLAAFIEYHSECLLHLMEGLIEYKKRLNIYRIKSFLTGFVFTVFLSGIISYLLFASSIESNIVMISGLSSCVALFTGWLLFPHKFIMDKFQSRQISNLDTLTDLNNQTKKDSWKSVKSILLKFIKTSKGSFSLKKVKLDYQSLEFVKNEGSRDIREGINELSTIKYDE